MADVEGTTHPEVAYYYPAPYWRYGEVDAVKTLTAERGLPPNTELRAALEPSLEPTDKKVAAYLSSIESDVTDAGGIGCAGGVVDAGLVALVGAAGDRRA